MQRKIDTFNHFQTTFNNDSLIYRDFYIERRENVPIHTCLSSYRRDFYKISFITRGEGLLFYGDKKVNVEDGTLIISNPQVSFRWEPTTEKQEGYFCLFTENFIQNELKNKSSIFFLLHETNDLIFPLSDISVSFIETIFASLYKEFHSDYVNKYDLLNSYIHILLHEIVKDRSVQSENTFGASERISKIFFNLLNNEMLINSVNNSIGLKTPKEYASRLSIHVNHLNRALKEYTGKTTSQLIAERITFEAKSLLLHTDWDISQIAFCLGFQYPSNFQVFFKKQTNMSPKEFRQANVSNS